MAKVVDVARYILDHAGAMPTMKLQELVYYCQAWSLAWDGVPLFDEDFQAWANGPVCPELFATHEGRFWLSANSYNDRDPYSFTQTQQETMDAVLEGYADKEPLWLSELSRVEQPWREARQDVKPGEPCDAVIPKDLLQRYYRSLEDIEDEQDSIEYVYG